MHFLPGNCGAMQERLSIVLSSPQGDANIGAAARAMKNFGFTDLRLVNPVPHLTSPAYTWAVDAKDILEAARVEATLDAALADNAYAVAFTRRIGHFRKRSLALAEAAPMLAARARAGSAALVFGREDKGLSNAEVRRCDAIVEIPTEALLPSLNLAQSVLLACYEVRRALGSADASARVGERFVSREEVTPLLRELDAMLARLQYENDPRRRLRSKILAQLEKIFGRSGLTSRDVRMLEGLCARIQQTVKGAR
jgi:tRNA/rRNA methyltransferase